MDVTEQKRKIIKWDYKDFGLFEATIWDGKLTDYRACLSGSLPSINTDNIEFLKKVRDSINELLKHVK